MTNSRKDLATGMGRREVVIRTDRGFDRLVNFTDATIAIAITLLILPIMDGLRDTYSEEGGSISDVGQFLTDERVNFYVFVQTFFVMFWLWWANHKTFEKFAEYDFFLVVLSFVWIVFMVALAFPLDLAAHSDSNLATAWANFAFAVPITITAVINLYGRARPHMLSDHADIEVIRAQMLFLARLLLFVALVAGLLTSIAILFLGTWGLIGWALVLPALLVYAIKALRGEPVGHARNTNPLGSD